MSPFCIAAAHCLHTVTEDNPELLCSLNTAVLGVLENVLLSSQPDMAHTLLGTLAAGENCHFFLNEWAKISPLLPLQGFKMTLIKVLSRQKFFIDKVPVVFLSIQEHCGT